MRYLEYSGYNVKRGMNYTDVEDKAVREAYKRRITVPELTSVNIQEFQKEMRLLGMKMPDYFPRASENVDNALKILEALLQKGIAYRHGINYYFDPLKFPGFGKLYGLDMGNGRRGGKGFTWTRIPACTGTSAISSCGTAAGPATSSAGTPPWGGAGRPGTSRTRP